MEIVKIISKSKDGRKMEVIAQNDKGIKRTLHVVKEGNKYKYFDGHEIQIKKAKGKSPTENLMLDLLLIPFTPGGLKNVETIKVPKFGFATMKEGN